MLLILTLLIMLQIIINFVNEQLCVRYTKSSEGRRHTFTG